MNICLQSLCILALAGFAALPFPVFAQGAGGADNQPASPLTSPIELRLTQSQRFRVGIVINNSGDFPDRLGRLGTLVGEGTVVPVPQGFFWRVTVSRSQVDAHALSDGQPLVELELVTDAHGKLQGETIKFTKRMHGSAEGRRHAPYLIAAGLSLSGVVALALPEGPIKQGASLGSLQGTVNELLSFLEPGVKLSAPMPSLTVDGTRPVMGKPALHAVARGPVSFIAPLGAATVQSESQMDISLESGVPLTGQFRLMGRLPGGAGQMDFSVRTTLRPY